MIDFYTNPLSRGAIARWMLEEIGVPYTTHTLEYGTAMKATEYLAINPMGKVPAIVHDGVVITEAAAICAYLADAFPQANMAPSLSDRAGYYRWLFFGAGPLEAAVTNTAIGIVVPDERRRTIGYGCLFDVLTAMDKHLSQNDYFACGRFTAADVYTGSQLGWGLSFGTIPERASFTAYWDRIKDRPARLKAIELDGR